jgi:hypothetical protein
MNADFDADSDVILESLSIPQKAKNSQFQLMENRAMTLCAQAESECN